MVDIAEVQIRADFSQLTQAERALRQLTETGRRAQTELGGVGTAMSGTESAVEGVGDAADRTGAELREAGQAGQQLSASAQAVSTRMRGAEQSLRGTGAASRTAAAGVKTAAAATQSLGAAQRTAGAAMQATTAAARQQATAMQAAGQAMRRTNAHGQALTRTSSTAGFATANLAAQFNDIGVMLASGQSPLLLAAQQGTQINQVMTQMRATGQSTGRALLSAFTSIISPMSILTIGTIAGGAALVQWGLGAIGASNETRSLEDAIDDLTGALDQYEDSLRAVRQSQADLVGELGPFADDARRIHELFAQLDYAEVLRESQRSASDLRATFSSFLATSESGFNDLFNLAQRGTVQLSDQAQQIQRQIEAVFDAIEARTGGRSMLGATPAEAERLNELMAQFNQSTTETAAGAGDIYAQFKLANDALESGVASGRQALDLAQRRHDALVAAAQADGEISNEEAEILRLSGENVLVLQRQVALKEGLVELDDKEDDRARKNLERAKDRLEIMKGEILVQSAIAVFGSDHIKVLMDQDRLHKIRVEQEIEQLGLTGEIADEYREQSEILRQVTEAARARKEEEREALRLAREQERERKRALREEERRRQLVAQTRAELEGHIRVSEAIIRYGRESLEVKQAERAIELELFRAKLANAEIDERRRDALIEMWQHAKRLEDQIAASEPVWNRQRQVVDGIAQAWGDWVADGFDDFKSFADRVGDTFKKLLADMVAEAAARPLMEMLFGAAVGTRSVGLSGAAIGGGGGLGQMLFGGAPTSAGTTPSVTNPVPVNVVDMGPRLTGVGLGGGAAAPQQWPSIRLNEDPWISANHPGSSFGRRQSNTLRLPDLESWLEGMDRIGRQRGSIIDPQTHMDHRSSEDTARRNIIDLIRERGPGVYPRIRGGGMDYLMTPTGGTADMSTDEYMRNLLDRLEQIDANAERQTDRVLQGIEALSAEEILRNRDVKRGADATERMERSSRDWLKGFREVGQRGYSQAVGEQSLPTPDDLAARFLEVDRRRLALQQSQASREEARLQAREDARQAAIEQYWERQAEKQESQFNVRREVQEALEGGLRDLGRHLQINPDLSGLPGVHRRSAPETEAHPEPDMGFLEREFRRQVEERIGRNQEHIDSLQQLLVPISYRGPAAEDVERAEQVISEGQRTQPPLYNHGGGTWSINPSLQGGGPSYFLPAAGGGGGLNLSNLLMLYLMSSNPGAGLGLSVLSGLLGGGPSSGGGGGLGGLFGGGGIGNILSLGSSLFGGSGNGLFGGLFGGGGGLGGIVSGLFSPAGFSGTGIGSSLGGVGSFLFGSQAAAGTMAAPAAAQAFLSSGAFTANAGAAAVYGTGFSGGLNAALSSGNGLLSIGANTAAAGGGFGAALGAVAPILGAVILGGLLMSSKKLLDTGLNIGVQDDQATFESYDRVRKSRLFGLIRSTSTSTHPLDEEAAGPLRDAVTSMHTQVEAAAETLGFGADALENFSYRVNLSLMGLDEDERAAKVEETMKAIGDRMAFGLIAGAEERTARLEAAQQELADARARVGHRSHGGGQAGTTYRVGPSDEAIAALEENVRRAEAAVAALGEESGVAGLELDGARERMMALAEALTSVNNVLDQLGHTAFEASLKGGQLSESLLLLFSGIEDAASLDAEQRLEAVRQGAAVFQESASAYYQAFYTESERMDRVRQTMVDTLAELNTALPESKDAFRELVEAQDLTTEKGRELYAVLLQLAGSFDTVTQYEERLAAAREQAAEQAARAAEQQVAAELVPQVGAAQQASALRFTPSRIYASDDVEGATSPLDRFRRAAAGQLTAGRRAVGRSVASEARSRSEAARSAQQAARSAREATRAESYQTQFEASFTPQQREVWEAGQSGGFSGRIGRTDYYNWTPESARRWGFQDFLPGLTDAQRNLRDTAEEARNLSERARGLSEQARGASRAAAAAAVSYARAAEAHRDYSSFLWQIRHLGLTFDVGAKQAQRYAKTVVGMFDDLDEFTAKTSAYYQNFFSEEERRRNLEADLALDFDYLGLVMPRTRKEFRALVEAQDLTTEAGQKTFAALIDIAGQFAAVTEESRTLEDALRGQQGLFRTLSREIFVTSAPQLSNLGSGDEMNGLLREIIRHIQAGNISAARQRADLLDEQRRERYQPTEQTLPS